MSEEYIGPQQVSLNAQPLNRIRTIVEIPNGTLPLICVDPGGVTGWSLLVLRSKVLEQEVFSHPLEMILRSRVSWVHGQIDCRDDENLGINQLCRLVSEWPSAAIVFESFFVRQMAADLSPVRIIAAVKYHLWLQRREMVMQQPAMGKRINNERLKLLGCYTSDGGLEHARDADRHAIMAVRRCMEGSEFRSELWPRVFGPITVGRKGSRG